MHPIVRYWPYVSLAARHQQDYDLTNKIPSDYVRSVLLKWHPKAIKIVELLCGLGSPEANYYSDTGNYTRKLADINKEHPYSYVIELGDRIIFAHSGTRNNKDMLTNFTGAISGGIKGLNPFMKYKPECHESYWKQGVDTFKTLLPWFKHAKNTGKFIVQSCHSKGCGRGSVVARLAVEYGFDHPLTTLYCPPPTWTKKGVKIFNGLGLSGCTYEVISNNDIVDNADMFGFYRLVGNTINLPDVKGNVADIPLVGGHAYSTVNSGLILWCKENNRDLEGAEYLESKAYVSVC